MNNRHTLYLTAGALALGTSAAIPCVHADPFLPVPPASFLNYHVSTARGLSEEVAQDVVVRARLARHFGMSAPALTSYVRENLVETALTARQAGRYRVACISPSGREYFVSERLGAGTPVFALAATGQPVLKLACGNPLVAALPVMQAKQPMKRLLHDAALASDPTAVPGQTVVASATLPDEETFTTSPALSGYEFADGGPIVGVGGITQVLTSGGGLGFLPGLLGAAALIGVTTGHGHGSSSNPTPAPPPTPTPAPAPEPAAGTIYALGGAAVGALGLRAARRRATSA